MIRYGISVFLITLFLTTMVQAQEKEIKPYGEVRLAYLGNTNSATGLGNDGDEAGDFFGIRLRYGVKYSLNQNSLFAARLAGQFRDDTDDLSFTIKAEGDGINPGTISFDELYYQFKNETTTLRLGRFQQNLNVLSNSGRNSIRFQSNVIFIHWTDGLYLKQQLNDEWYGQVIAEYQPRNATTFPYKGGLDFGNNEHNFTAFAGVENTTRDKFNIIQKGIGLFVAPNTYFYDGEYKSYIAFISRIAFDFPQKEALDGGSIRISGEFSQNLISEFSDGTNAILTAGINRFASKHDLMIEFSRTDPEWLIATTYAPSNDEMELRYRFYASNKIWLDARYRVRVKDNPAIPYRYSTFLRLNYTI